MHVMLLCKVVDNYGDIGFVYRLSRSLSEKHPELELSLVVSDLKSFSQMAPGIVDCPMQKYGGWNVLDWNASDECRNFFTERPAPLILECFQCGRPEWLDEILFSEKQKSTVQIVNIEYLTAEKWADDFHMLKSGTRSPLVKKMNFMPGFTPRTGGLVLDDDFMESLSDGKSALKKIESCLKKSCGEKSAEKIISHLNGNFFNVTVFAYDRNMENLARALSEFQDSMKEKDSDFSLNVFAASGLSFGRFEKAWNELGRPFEMTALPYLDQKAWDALITLCDFNFIRGEDSFSRACLSGKPFIWNAYMQDEEFQLVKVRAFVDFSERFFMERNASVQFENFRNAMMIYNMTEGGKRGIEAEESLSGCNTDECEKDALLKILLDTGVSIDAFRDMGRNLVSNGNLAEKLEPFFKT